MKPHPRIRKSVKWGGGIVTALLVLIWGGSAVIWSELSIQPYFVAGAKYGCIVWIADPSAITYKYNGVSAGGNWNYGGFSLEWQFERTKLAYYIPLWPFVLVVAVPTACAWRLDDLSRRRAMKHLCSKCFYDRTGLAPRAVCPECGAPPPPA